MSDAPALRLNDVSVRYGTLTVVERVSADLHRGELVAAIGPNGAGKSSLFKAIVGLVPHGGEVSVRGHRCHHRHDRGDLAYIPQHSDIDLTFPITVAEVVAAGRRRFGSWWRQPSASDRAAALTALDAVGLSGADGAVLRELSGGQLQRVLLARALAQESTVMLLDEALSGVDQPSTLALLDLLRTLSRRGAVIVVATHDLALTRRHFDRCLALNRRLVGDGPPRELMTDAVLDATFGTAA